MAGETGGQLPHVRICTWYPTDYSDPCKLSLIEMSKAGGLSYTWSHRGCKSWDAPRARQALTTGGHTTAAKPALEPGITHWLYVSWHVGWWPQTIEQLLRTGYPIVSASYAHPVHRRSLYAGMWAITPGNPGPLVADDNEGVCHVDWVGPDCVLISRQALEAMESPYWRHIVIKHIEDVGGGQVRHHAVEVADYIGLCLQAQALHIPVVIDCATRVAPHYEADARPVIVTPVGTSFAMSDPSYKPFANPEAWYTQGSTGSG